MKRILDNLNKVREDLINIEYNKVLDDLEIQTINNPLSTEYFIWRNYANEEVAIKVIDKLEQDGVNTRLEYLTSPTKYYLLRIIIPMKYKEVTCKPQLVNTEDTCKSQLVNTEDTCKSQLIDYSLDVDYPLDIEYTTLEEQNTVKIKITNRDDVLDIVNLYLKCNDDFVTLIAPTELFYSINSRNLLLKPSKRIKPGECIEFEVKINNFTKKERKRLTLGDAKGVPLQYNYRLADKESVFGELSKSGLTTIIVR